MRLCYLGLVIMSLFTVGECLLYAEDFVCSDGAGAFVQYLHSIDPTKVEDKINCLQVNEEQIPAQLALLASVPTKFLAVSAGLVVEVDQQTKDAILAAEQAVKDAETAESAVKAAARQAARDDLAALGAKPGTVEVLIPAESPIVIGP